MNILSNSNESILCLSDSTTCTSLVPASFECLTVLTSEYFEQIIMHLKSVVGFERWDYSVTVDSNIPVCALPHCTSK